MKNLILILSFFFLFSCSGTKENEVNPTIDITTPSTKILSQEYAWFYGNYEVTSANPNLSVQKGLLITINKNGTITANGNWYKYWIIYQKKGAGETYEPPVFMWSTLPIVFDKNNNIVDNGSNGVYKMPSSGNVITFCTPYTGACGWRITRK
jgi:hypothetical protein